MPAPRLMASLVILMIFTEMAVHLPNNSLGELGQLRSNEEPMTSSVLDGALGWLVSNQTLSGSYGAFQEHLTAAAAYALWQNNSGSPRANLSFSWLATQMNSSSAWFWGTESDIPGVVLYSIASSGNLPLINKTFVKDSLLQLQLPQGGFEGYYDFTLNTTVVSSVDTDMALLGLITAKAIPAQNQTLALGYLGTLQNSDGSFNLTRTRLFDPFYSLGPDTISITAVTLLALNAAGYPSTEPHVSMALNFLTRVTSSNFGEGHLYAAATTALALKAYNQANGAVSSLMFILSHENCNGGFGDISRSSYPQSNALDTGWAARAIETGFPSGTGNIRLNSPRVNCAPVSAFSINPLTPSIETAVHFNGSASYDPDAERLSYVWTFGDGSNAEGATVTHTYAAAGNFTVSLKVTDSGTNPGPLSDIRSQTLTIKPTTVQNSAGTPTKPTYLLLAGGAIGLLAVIGLAFYFGRRIGVSRRGVGT